MATTKAAHTAERLAVHFYERVTGNGFLYANTYTAFATVDDALEHYLSANPQVARECINIVFERLIAADARANG